MAKTSARSEVPVDQTWNLQDIFPSDAAWEAELAAIAADLPSVTQFKGRLGEGAPVLLACLTAQEALYERLSRLSVYATCKQSEDGSAPANQGRAGRSSALGARVAAAVSFIRSELMALPPGSVKAYQAAEPGLAPFHLHLQEMLDYRPHTLTAETEQVLASLSEVMSAPITIYNRARASDMQFRPVTQSSGEAVPVSPAVYEARHELSSDTELRRNAYASFIEGLTPHMNTLATTFATEVKKNVVVARARGFESATQMLLWPQQVGLKEYNNVLDTIQSELAPHMRRYARLLQRRLGVERLRFCDLKAPLASDEPPLSFAEAGELIVSALRVLGPEYAAIIRSAVSERWVDWADNVGKAAGAFEILPFGIHPYILITWTGTLRWAFVLAHELGHAGHFALAQANQRLANLRCSAFFLEAPSTCNELLLAQHILSQNPDHRVRRAVLAALLSTYYHNFITHLLEGELQRRIYALVEAGQAVTAQTLNEEKGDILQRFWGDAVELDQGARMTWMRQQHYYMGLYPYTYAAGLTVATSVAQAIQSEGRPAAQRWLTTLQAGGSLRAPDLLRSAGVDLSSPEPVRKAVAFVGSLVDQLEQLYA